MDEARQARLGNGPAAPGMEGDWAKPPPAHVLDVIPEAR